MVQIWGPIRDTFKTVLMGGSKNGVVSGVEVNPDGEMSVTDATGNTRLLTLADINNTLEELVSQQESTNAILREAFGTLD